MNTEIHALNTAIDLADIENDQLAIDAIDWTVSELEFEERVNFETGGGSGTGSYC